MGGVEPTGGGMEMPSTNTANVVTLSFNVKLIVASPVVPVYFVKNKNKY